MRFNFKKVASVLASAAMLGSTLGIAAAASYPQPFVANGMTDVAVVVGSQGVAAQQDFIAATNIGANLNQVLASQAAGTGGDVSTSGETKALFTSSSKIYLNDSINTNKGTLTKGDLATVLADGEFNGNVDASYTQRLVLGANPRTIFAKQPTSDDDPVTGIKLGTTATTQYIYNATVSFDQTVNFTHADSSGEKIKLFGQDLTVAGATTSTKLVMLRSAETIDLAVGGNNPNPSQTVTVDGKTYTVELVTATDSSATIRVTDENGNSDTAEINEAASKKIKGLEVAVNLADENTATNSNLAEVVVGASKLTFQDGNAVKEGSGDDVIEGTQVDFVDTTITGNITQLVIQVAAQDDDSDAITPAMSYSDPVFNSFRVDFPGLNIADSDTENREIIEVKNSGSDKMTVMFADYNGEKPSSAINWVYNRTDAQGEGNPLKSGAGMSLADSGGDKIRVVENTAINKSEYVVIGNEDEGGLYEVSSIINSSSGYTDDSVEFKDVFTGETIKATITAEGSGTIVLKGKTYDVNYYSATSTLASAARTIRLNYPDSTSNNAVIYPTIQTSKGAKVAFFEPVTLNLSSFNEANSNNITGLDFPDGDGYTSVTITPPSALTNAANFNWTVGTTDVNTNVSGGVDSATATIGVLTYNISSAGQNHTVNVNLQTTAGANIVRPALVIFEEKDDNNNYEAVIVELDAGYDGDSAGIGVNDVDRTWGADGANGDSDAWDYVQLESDSDLYKDMDLWGTIATTDASDSDQSNVMISYPDDQVYVQVYVSSVDAIVSTEDGATGNIVPVYDTESAKISGKNLIVVGGSCVNTVAAELLGSTGKLCGEDFTTATGIGSGEYLIQTFSRTGGKVATLVAGYDAADTTNAASSIVNNKPEISAGKKYKGSTADTLTAA